jgi:Arc/MetJ family transcription regulator
MRLVWGLGCEPRTRLFKLPRMPTNLAIDDELLSEAQKVGGYRTKKDTVNEALREYIQRQPRDERHCTRAAAGQPPLGRRRQGVEGGATARAIAA